MLTVVASLRPDSRNLGPVHGDGASDPNPLTSHELGVRSHSRTYQPPPGRCWLTPRHAVAVEQKSKTFRHVILLCQKLLESQVNGGGRHLPSETSRVLRLGGLGMTRMVPCHATTARLMSPVLRRLQSALVIQIHALILLHSA